ncbi:hypothetical protein F0562_022373 [Nyssa sinensis]|uniref:FAF domain-containing protein n=1 Tax=Nyssa sinensis TaxID=561372 RepID=A0A5J5BNG2_9ASTE|nr:hypothetical protein F0562_022373 [Nyssa sinensis]
MKMSASLGKSLRLSSPLKVEEEAKVVEKQGIVSILGSDCDRTKAGSLRRTLSADMSSKKWLAQHGFSPMKKIASSEQFPISSTADSPYSSSGGEDDQLERPEQEQVEKPGQFDMWSSILCQKADEDSSKLPPPYIHPLVKRSTSSLSEKSLEVCTESLGSETGSDGFSSYPPSETGDVEEDKEETQAEPQEEEKESQFFDREELRVVKYNKKSLPKSFPPPLPSLARRDGPSVHMQCHRENGRLVLEAVSVPSQNYFHAQRQDGRLLLTLVNNPPQPQEKGKEEEFEEVFENEVEVEVEAKEVGEEEEDQEEEEEMVDTENGEREMGILMEQAPKQSSGVINVHRSAVMMKRLMGIDNRNRTWTQKFNKAVNLVKMEMEVEEEVSTQLPQSLPLRPRVGRLIPAPPAAAASFNAYEYFWRAKPSVATMINPLTKQCPPHQNNCNKVILSNTGPKAYEKEELVKADYLVPLVRGCKEPRRSLLIWEPCCIATS